MRSLRSPSLSLGILLPLGILTGCALPSTAPPVDVPGVALQGVVHGGKQPVVGAKVFLLQANTTGYGGAGIAALPTVASIAIDGSGDVWVADYSNSNLVELIGAAVPVVTPIAANLVSPYGTSSVNKP